MDITTLVDLYYNQKKSLRDIAAENGTYVTKLSKLLKANGYTLKTKAETQREVLETGKSKHPTKGTKRPDEVKRAISESNHKVWANLSKKERKKRSKIGKEVWNSMTEEQREEFLKKGRDAVRKTSKEGSKMENYLYGLLSQQYTVTMHKKGLVANEKLEVDLYVVELNTVIEIDGPSHFDDIWKDGSLERNIRADNEKTSLLINNGYTIVRAMDLRKNKSDIYFRQAGEKILKVLEDISNKKLGNFIEVNLDV